MGDQQGRIWGRPECRVIAEARAWEVLTSKHSGGEALRWKNGSVAMARDGPRR